MSNLSFQPTITVWGGQTQVTGPAGPFTIFESESLNFEPMAAMGLGAPQIQQAIFRSGANTAQFSLGANESLPAGFVLSDMQIQNVGVVTEVIYDVTFAGIILDEAQVSRGWSVDFPLTLAVGLPGASGSSCGPMTGGAVRQLQISIALSSTATPAPNSSADAVTLFPGDSTQVELLAIPPLVNPGFSSLTFVTLIGGELVGAMSLGAMESMPDGLIISGLGFQNVTPAEDGSYQFSVSGTVQNDDVTVPWCIDPELLVKSTAEPIGGGGIIVKNPQIIPVAIP